MTTTVTIVRREDSKEFERVVYGEILVPGQVNTFNELWTEKSVREAMYLFASKGFGVDVEHDGDDVSADKDVVIVESFIAREGDPDFVEGSWVVGVKINDDGLWEKVLSGEINGFSFEGTVLTTDVLIVDDRSPIAEGVYLVEGETEPDLIDGHTHTFTALVDNEGRVISGVTGETEGHVHQLSLHTSTDESEGHKHRYQLTEDSYDD